MMETLLRTAQEVQQIPIHKILFHEKNHDIYNADTDESLGMLLEDIKANGIRTPVHILPNGKLLSGGRRTACALRLNLSYVPAIVEKDMNEADQIAALISFNQYRNKTPREIFNEGEELKKLVKRGSGRKTAVIAEQLGVGSSRQYERIEEIMTKAPEHIKDAVDKGEMSISAAHNDIRHLEQQDPEIRDRAKKLLSSGNEKDIQAAVRKARRAWKAEQTPIVSAPAEEMPESTVTQNGGVLVFYPYDIPDLKVKTAWEPNQAVNDCLLGNFAGHPIKDYVSDDGLLFLWTYARTMPFALNLLKNWGFTFLTFASLKSGNHPFLEKGILFEDSSAIIIAKKDGSATPRRNQAKSNSLGTKSRNGLMEQTPASLIDFVMAFNDGPYLQIYGPNMPERCDDEGWLLIRP